MSLRHLTKLNDYLSILRQDKDEVQALIKDLLISVTHFFRDPDAWKVLQEQVVRPLVKKKSTEEPIRVWVAGCATGEEAYSVAMIILDELSGTRKECPVQIFASDVNRDAITVARPGAFSGNDIRGRVATADCGGISCVKAIIFASAPIFATRLFSRSTICLSRSAVFQDGSDYLPKSFDLSWTARLKKKILPLFHYALEWGRVHVSGKRCRRMWAKLAMIYTVRSRVNGGFIAGSERIGRRMFPSA